VLQRAADAGDSRGGPGPCCRSHREYAQPRATTNVIENTSLSAKFARQISLAFYLAHAKMRPVQNLIEAQTPIVT